MAPPNVDCRVSIIVPTYDEVDNIRPLTERIFKTIDNVKWTAELLIMDDESKGTPKTESIVAELQKEGHPVRIHVRRKGEGKGLSSAVLLGFSMAKHPIVLCMDADLQHEPESIPKVVLPILINQAEFSVGSRNVSGGEVVGWTLIRKTISVGATILAWPLTPCSDPMSGFFATSTKVLKRGEKHWNPMGFKIGLELMVKCRCENVMDVPISFCDRVAGESKLSMTQNILFIRQLLGLYYFKYEALIQCTFSLILGTIFAYYFV